MTRATGRAAGARWCAESRAAVGEAGPQLDGRDAPSAGGCVGGELTAVRVSGPRGGAGPGPCAPTTRRTRHPQKSRWAGNTPWRGGAGIACDWWRAQGGGECVSRAADLAVGAVRLVKKVSRIADRVLFDPARRRRVDQPSRCTLGALERWCWLHRTVRVYGTSGPVRCDWRMLENGFFDEVRPAARRRAPQGRLDSERRRGVPGIRLGGRGRIREPAR